MANLFLTISLVCNIFFHTKDASQDLLKACKNDNLEGVKLALKAGANANVKDNKGNSALIYACLPKDSKEKHEIRKLLIEAGADVNAKDASYEMTVLDWVYAAKDIATINILLQHNVEINGTDKSGGKVLLFALEMNADDFKANTYILELLANKGLMLDPKWPKGASVFTEAAKRENIELIKFLLAHHISVNTTDKDGNTALMEACKNANVSIVKLLLENKADVNIKATGGWVKGSTALIEAMNKPNVEIVNLLIDKGADVNAKTSEGRTTLMKLGEGTNAVEVATLLISKGVDVNAKATNGWTALHSAAISGNLALVKLLLSKKADSKAKDENTQTPLDYAKSANKTDVVQLLSKYK